VRTQRFVAPVVAILIGLALTQTSLAGGRWSVGVYYGGPVYRPWPYYPYYYYPYRPVYVEPAPVIVQQPPPVVVQQAPAPQPIYQSAAPASMTTSASIQQVSSADIDFHLRQLGDPNESVRADSAVQLGKLKAARAIDPLAATLAGDQSPRVREAAARALALVGSPNALPALQHAALSDNDRDVRRSAQFAVDIIQQQGR